MATGDLRVCTIAELLDGQESFTKKEEEIRQDHAEEALGEPSGAKGRQGSLKTDKEINR